MIIAVIHFHGDLLQAFVLHIALVQDFDIGRILQRLNLPDDGVLLVDVPVYFGIDLRLQGGNVVHDVGICGMAPPPDCTRVLE